MSLLLSLCFHLSTSNWDQSRRYASTLSYWRKLFVICGDSCIYYANFATRSSSFSCHLSSYWTLQAILDILGNTTLGPCICQHNQLCHSEIVVAFFYAYFILSFIFALNMFFLVFHLEHVLTLYTVEWLVAISNCLLVLCQVVSFELLIWPVRS